MPGLEIFEAFMEDSRPAQALFALLDDDRAHDDALAVLPLLHDALADAELSEGLLARLLDRSRCPRGQERLAATFSALEGNRERSASLLQQLQGGTEDERVTAAVALGSRGNEAAVAALQQALCDACLRVRVAAVEALADIACDAAIDALLDLVEEEGHEPRLLCAALSGLRGGAGARLETTLRLHLAHGHTEVRLSALTSLRELPALAEGAFVRDLLSDEDARVRALALGVLERHGDAADREAAQAMLADPDPRVRGMARDAFYALGGGVL
jgi:HEAT repeat protein